jgi:hypothetical protein
MQQAAIILARAIGFIETYDLVPRGGLFYPDFVREVVQRYNFQKFPQEFKDFDESKGIEFQQGRSGDTVIDKAIIYNTGILMDTRSNTKISQALIEDALLWARSEFGVVYQPGQIKNYAFVSQVTFYSDINLTALNPALRRLVEQVTSAVNDIHKEQLEYETAGLSIQYDMLKRKYALAAFTITRRLETPFSEHKYFSESPLPTDLHWKLLEEFEAAMLRQAAHDIESPSPRRADILKPGIRKFRDDE